MPVARSSPLAYVLALATVGVAAALAALVAPRVTPVNLAMIFLLAVVAAALAFGRGPSTLAALAAVATFDFFFVSPHLTFAVDEAQYLLTFAGMLVVGVTISTLVERLRGQAEGARARAARATALWELGRELGGADFEGAVLHAAMRQVRELYAGEPVVLMRSQLGELEPREGIAAGFLHDPRERDAAEWAFENRTPIGARTRERRGARGLYVPIPGPLGDPLGVLGVVWDVEPATLPEDPVLLMETFAAQVGLALERVRHEEERSGIRAGGPQRGA